LQVYDDAFNTRGNHGLKFGFEYLRQHNDVIAINGITAAVPSRAAENGDSAGGLSDGAGIDDSAGSGQFC